MSRPVVVGIDGSAPSAAAAQWAAREAYRNGCRLRMVHVSAMPSGDLEPEERAGTQLPDFAVRLRERIVSALPGLEVSCEQLPGAASYVLAAAGERGRLLVLGSRGLGGFAGPLVGSVGLRTAAHAGCPVILVRSATVRGDSASGEVVVGVDSARPSDAALGFAFEEAERRGAALRVVEGRRPSRGPYLTKGPVDQEQIRRSLAAAELVRLQDALSHWREKFPGVDAEAEVIDQGGARALVEASRTAGLVVLGRSALGHPLASPRLGPVAHAVLHHAHSPVAVVPHAA